MRIARRLAVQGRVLARLHVKDHRQQTGAGKAAWQQMGWSRRMADLLAVAARELLAHMLHPQAGSAQLSDSSRKR